MDNSKDMVKIAYAALEEKKAEDIRIIDITDVTIVADYFIIAHGNNSNQVTALVDYVQEVLHKQGYDSKRVEGYHTGGWILLDYGDIIIHIFAKEERLFYDLEKIWRNGKLIDLDSINDI